MNLEEHINKARLDYPNGYSDYIAKYPTDTIELWKGIYEDGKVDEVNGYKFDFKEMSYMRRWNKEKFWAFMGSVEFNIERNK